MDLRSDVASGTTTYQYEARFLMAQGHLADYVHRQHVKTAAPEVSRFMRSSIKRVPLHRRPTTELNATKAGKLGTRPLKSPGQFAAESHHLRTIPGSEK